MCLYLNPHCSPLGEHGEIFLSLNISACSFRLICLKMAEIKSFILLQAIVFLTFDPLSPSEFTEDVVHIPKGSSVIVKRIPIIGKSSSHSKTNHKERSDVQIPNAFGSHRK
ncbi:hypothetical protein ILYODFUR_033171 [Ilyodon furcidens]|uniref:Uncharacterized protein n=1 Tax=Ilyodon furcidens TaxID=33524 RepID=A0ABV0U3K8_9TELE